MVLIAAERIKLLSTKSPWWCMAIAVTATIGIGGLVAACSPARYPFLVSSTQVGYQAGLAIIMVMATLTVTTEYRFSTIRSTFQAIPNRTSAVLAKTVVATVLAGLVGEIAAFGAYGIATFIRPGAGLTLSTGTDWRNVAGMGLVYAISAVFAVAVGLLFRQSAAAVAIVLLFPLLIENLVTLIPKIGNQIQQWLPFHAAEHFLTGSQAAGYPYSPWLGLVYFTGIAVVLLTGGIIFANKRDA